MKFAEFEKLLHGPDMVRIIRDKKDIFVGYYGVMQYIDAEKIAAIRETEVIDFRAVPEIRHRQWKEKGLDAPMFPEQLPQYAFSDLMMTIYYKIYLKGD